MRAIDDTNDAALAAEGNDLAHGQHGSIRERHMGDGDDARAGRERTAEDVDELLRGGGGCGQLQLTQRHAAAGGYELPAAETADVLVSRGEHLVTRAELEP